MGTGTATMVEVVEKLSEIQKRVSSPTTLIQESCPSCLTMSDSSNYSCPDVTASDGDGVISWGLKQVQNYVMNCRLSPLKLVRRKNKKDLSTACLPDSYHDYSDKDEWEACPPPPICNEWEMKDETHKAQMQLLRDQSSCNPKLVTVVPNLKNSPKPVSIYDMCIPPLTFPDKIVIHHTAVTPYMDGAKIQNWHLKTGWSDMGYHFVIAKTKSGGWKVFEGRPLNRIGAHVGAGLNDKSIGIAIAGNYFPDNLESLTSGDLVPQPEAAAQLMALLDDLTKNNPTVRDIVAHSHAKLEGSGCHTECPGPGVEQIIPLLKSRFIKTYTPPKTKGTRTRRLRKI